MKNTQWLRKSFPPKSRSSSILIEADNVLEPAILKELLRMIFSIRSQCRQLHSHRVKRLLPAAGDGVQLDRMVRLVQRLVLVRWLVGVADLVVRLMRLMRWLFVRRLPGDQGRRQH